MNSTGRINREYQSIFDLYFRTSSNVRSRGSIQVRLLSNPANPSIPFNDNSTPVILARAGVLDGRKATAFPGVRRELEAHGAIFVDAVVERDGPIVTGGGPKTENAFANGILNALKSPA